MAPRLQARAPTIIRQDPGTDPGPTRTSSQGRTRSAAKVRAGVPLVDQRPTLANVVDHYVVTATAPDRETAVRLAASAVRAKLAATAQVHGPVTSFWWHLGEQGEGEEWFATFKTTSARYADLEAHLIAEHPWDNPEVTAVQLATGSAGYLTWLETTTAADSAG